MAKMFSGRDGAGTGRGDENFHERGGRGNKNFNGAERGRLPGVLEKGSQLRKVAKNNDHSNDFYSK